MKDSLFWIWLGLACTPGSETFITFARKNYSPYEIYSMTPSELEAAFGKRNADLRRLADKNLDDAKRINDYCFLRNVGLVSWEDEEYPLRLRQIENPPPLLYYTGRLPSSRDELLVSVVGTRTMSEYGRKTAFDISYDLALAGAVVVSGMALGIDGVASSGALCAGGETVVVLGCGIDRTYPSVHGILRRQIEKNGAVITEFPPGTPPNGRNFPIRNRIISGLSNAVLVVEGDMKSGALITARRAIQQGRDIYALPGNVGESNSEAPNYLIKTGAQAATCADDILKNYAYMYPGKIDLSRLLSPSRPDADERLAAFGVYRDIEFKGDNAQQKKKEPLKPLKKLFEKKIKKENTSITEDAAPSISTNAEEDIKEKLGDNAVAVYRAIASLSSPDVDAICNHLKLDSSAVMTALTMLEISGHIMSMPGGRYSLV